MIQISILQCQGLLYQMDEKLEKMGKIIGGRLTFFEIVRKVLQISTQPFAYWSGIHSSNYRPGKTLKALKRCPGGQSPRRRVPFKKELIISFEHYFSEFYTDFNYFCVIWDRPEQMNNFRSPKIPETGYPDFKLRFPDFTGFSS